MCLNPALDPAKLELRAARPSRSLAPSSASAVVSLSSYASMMPGASAASSAARTLGLESSQAESSQASIPNIHSTYPRPFGYAAEAGMSSATAAAALAILGVSAYTDQDDANFLAAVLALMSRPSPDHANTGLQATSQNLIAHSGKQDQPDRISRAREPSPSLSAAPRHHIART